MPKRSPRTRMRAASSASPLESPRPSRAPAASARSSSSVIVSKGASLVRLDVGGADHLAPGLGFLADVRAELFARAGVGLEPVLQQLLANVRRVEHLHELRVPAIEDLGGRLARRHERIPVRGLEA